MVARACVHYLVELEDMPRTCPNGSVRGSMISMVGQYSRNTGRPRILNTYSTEQKMKFVGCKFYSAMTPAFPTSGSDVVHPGAGAEGQAPYVSESLAAYLDLLNRYFVFRVIGRSVGHTHAPY